jgi:CHAT domain-containing protein/uncharacterized protein HemY
MRAELRRHKIVLKGFADFCHNTMQGEKNLNEQKAIKDYLLGALSNKAERRAIEEKILLDDGFAEQLLIAEDDLIDEYLDGNLDASENERFTEFFLKPPERKRKLRLARNLKKYAMKPKTQKVKKLSPEKTGWFDWRGLFNSPSVRLAATVLLLIIVGFVVWRAVFYQSDVDKGLAQLQVAYRGQRPTESRTTANFEYAPLTVTRGNEQTAADEKARARAERYLLDATENSTDAKAFHALGLFYLAEKQFDKALDEFKTALKFAPNDAKINSDIGAVYLEKAELAKKSGNQSEVSRNINSSLEHLNRALELEGDLMEALFNKALVLQKIPAPGQAREAWEKYLEKDSTSQWADEARRQLQKLRSNNPQNLAADELEQAFLTVFRRKDDAEATRLVSQNRELIKKKYLPQKLAMSFVQASGNEKDEYLRALMYVGDLEEKNIGDSFAKDLAAFYAKTSDSNLELLKQAQASTQNSYQQYLDDKNTEAFEEASRARQLFLQAGDVYEAKLSEFIIVYCLIQNNHARDSIPLAEEMAEFCRRSSYKWLLSNILYWLAGAQRSLGERAQADDNYKHCLALAEETKDAQVVQKILVRFANQNKFVGQNTAALNFLQQAFDAFDEDGPPLREKWRTYSASIQILSSLKLYSLAKAISLENIKLANDLKNSSNIADSQLDAGIVHAEAGDFEEARIQLNEAKQNASALSESADRTAMLAKSLLTLGSLETRLKNYSQAAKFYDEALSIVENKEVPFFLYEIERGRLLTDISLNRDSEIDAQITKTIGLAEDYRKRIPSELEKISFFNNQQDIYDIAVTYEFNHGKYEQAYNHLETSNARSLLSWLKKGVNVNEEKKQIEITFNETVQPLQLNEIRAAMPERVQILQYAVLEDKVLIWLVSKDNFTVVPSDIDSEKLNEKVAAYIQSVSDQNNQKQEEAKTLARELYDLLITPVVSQLDPTREICVIPQKILFHLPFAALAAPDGKPFLAQFNFFYAPSANVFLLSTENARQKSAFTDETFLSIGNPSFDRNHFENFKDLPEAEVEAKEITKYYPHTQKILVGPQATKTAVVDSLQHVEVINYAGHYLVNHGEPLASGLLLTKSADSDNAEDSILTNAELINQKLPRVKLVVLSACETGVEQYYNGEGLVGLSTTFLKAGAPLVVASQWKVDSSAAAELIKRFHFLRKQEKLSTTAALRRAQLEMMEAPDGSYRQPYFWAAFATYGGYAEF